VRNHWKQPDSANCHGPGHFRLRAGRVGEDVSEAQVLFYKKYLLGKDPTNIAPIMMNIRGMGAFKPWGAAVSAIEIALWDLFGKITGLPVYKLLAERFATRCALRKHGEQRA